MSATEIYLNKAGSSSGYFTTKGVAEGSNIALFTTKGSSNGLATVSPAYYAKVGATATLVDGSLTTHDWKIDATSGGTAATIKGGDYNDAISVKGGQTVYTGLGKDTVDVSKGTKVTLADYNYASDVIYVGTSGGFTTTSITTTGLVSVGTMALAQLNATDGYYKAVLKDNKSTVHFWKGSDSAQRLDGSAESNALFMVAGTSSDTLVGGSKNDTILTGSIAGVYAMGGAGNDSIVLGANGTKGDSIRQFVGISSSSGSDVVKNFTGGFGDGDDVLVLTDGTIEGATFTMDTTNNALVVKTGKGQASLAGVKNTLMMQTGTGTGEAVKVAVVKAGDKFAPATSDSLAAYYVSTGKKGQVDFTGISDDVVVELSNAGNYKGGAVYAGIDSVIGGAGNNTLVGAAATANYLQAGAGTGNSTLWGGGASKDTLQGNSNAADAFFVAQYDGKDTIQSFGVGVAETSDVLYMLNSPAAGVKNDGKNITLSFADGSSATLAQVGGNGGGANEAVQFTTDGTNIQAAVIGNSTKANTFGYSSDVNMYFGGTSMDDALTVSNDYDGASVDIRLNNTLPQTYASVERVSAANFGGDAFLSGSDESAERIIGSQGKTTLWGGLGAANDTLEGTSGDVTSFYFGRNNGADVIVASDSDDKVVFYDYANTDLTAIEGASSASKTLKFTFNDGSSLEIQNDTSASVQTFEFTNSSWTYDKATGIFTQTK